MNEQTATALLRDAPRGRHFCQIHRNPDELTNAVAAYAEAGLQRDDAVVLVAVPERIAAITAMLGPSHVESGVIAKQLVLLDAATTLARFWDGATLDGNAFREVIGGVLDAAREAGFRRVRAYGEMVNLLWKDGHRDTAIELEDCWNRLGREYRFCLFCGYEIDGLEIEAYDGPLHQVGRVHSDFPMSADDERLSRAIDAATHDVFGVPVSAMLTHSAAGDRAGEQRLPSAHRTVLWLQRHMPHAVTRVLKRARVHYGV